MLLQYGKRVSPGMARVAQRRVAGIAVSTLSPWTRSNAGRTSFASRFYTTTFPALSTHQISQIKGKKANFHSSVHRNKASSVFVDLNDTPDTASSSSSSSSSQNPLPDFDDAQASFATKTTAELYRSALTYNICQLTFLVEHAESLLNLTRRLLGDWFTDTLLKATLFGHFCAGTDRENIRPAIKSLEHSGIGSILDFAAEDDGETPSRFKPKPHTTEARLSSEDTMPYPESDTRKQTPVRVYDYLSEAKCDQHLQDFRKCIRDVASLGNDGYAAVKITALGSPELLKKMSTAIVEAQKLFAKFDTNGDGLISPEEFEEQYRKYFDVDESIIRQLKDDLRCTETGHVDYITWSMTISPRDLPRITCACREQGPLYLATPTSEELELMENMYSRGRALAEEAATYGTRLLIDAEQVRFQPAIDNLVTTLQQTYNSTDTATFPLIYNTYQCYLKDSLDRLRLDVERSERFNYHFGAKLVRGAYMKQEGKLAEEQEYPNPIHDSIENTHQSYNDAVDFLMEHASRENGKNTEVMLATHNRESIEKAIDCMHKYGIDRHATTTSFGQLFGMADNVSATNFWSS